MRSSTRPWSGGRAVRATPGATTGLNGASFVNEIFVSTDGKLWVEVIRTAGNRWEFFNPEGRLLGSVPAVPFKERTVPVFRGDHLATVRQDDLDLDHVDVWRLERQPAGR